MTFTAHIEAGRIVPDVPVELPEGATVEVRLVQDQTKAFDVEIHPDVKRFSGILPKNLDYREAFYEGQVRKHL